MITKKYVERSLLFILLICSGIDCQSQEQFQPSVLILTPDQVKKDTSLDQEIQEQERRFEELRNELINKRKRRLENKERKNLDIINKKFIQFYKGYSFYSKISVFSARYLLYSFYNHFPNSLVYPINKKSKSNKESLSKLADKHSVRYILNFPKVKSEIINNSKYTHITAQLYDHTKKSFTLDTVIKGKNENPHDVFTCENEGLSCTFNNALSKILPKVSNIILKNDSRTIQKEKLAKRRFEKLLSKYYPQSPPKKIPQIIQQRDSTISTEGYYQGLMSNSRRKLIGFFANDPDVESLEELRNMKNDKNVKTVIKNNDKDTTIIYAYIVVGVKTDEQWYFTKKEVSYFKSPSLEVGKKEYFKNLHKWDFFKNNSLEINPDFWNTGFFAKVKDLREDPDWEKYGDNIWEKREKENRPYIGQYKIVAEIKKRRRKKIEEKNEEKSEEELNERFRRRMKKEVFIPFFDSLVKSDNNTYKNYKLLGGDHLTMLYPPSKDQILTVIALIDQEGEMFFDYFYFDRSKDKLYKWNYFEPKDIEEPDRIKIPSYYGEQVVGLISKITEWDYRNMYLDDQKFWENYVTKMEECEYVYLRSIQ